ncbi:MAG TPA: hypothetical protein VN700_06930 [Vicinamibacterales bacterium]|nr:hypothetical protein [Vicinamibacterales bacterium]
MTWKDKLEIGLKDDAAFRRDNLPDFQKDADVPETKPGDETRSPEVPGARAEAARKAGPHAVVARRKRPRGTTARRRPRR